MCAQESDCIQAALRFLFKIILAIIGNRKNIFTEHGSTGCGKTGKYTCTTLDKLIAYPSAYNRRTETENLANTSNEHGSESTNSRYI